MSLGKFIILGMIIFITCSSLSNKAIFLQQPTKIKPYWYVTWGESADEGIIGIETYNNYVYAAGVKILSDVLSAFLLKYDDNGDLIWYTTWEGEGMAAAADVAVFDDYIYVTGGMGSPENPDAFLSKFDTNGDLIWYKTWGGNDYEVAWGMEIHNGYIYLNGDTDSFGAGGRDIFLLKYDTDGNLIWNKTWGGVETEESGRLAASNNRIYVTGTTSSYGYGVPGDMILLKYDTNGNLIWNKTWGGEDIERGTEVDISQGYIYITGYTYSSGYDVFLLKYDMNGNLIWNKTWGGVGKDDGIAIEIYDSAIYVVGDTCYGEGGGDVVLLKYADDGTLFWAKTWGGDEAEFPFDIDIENEMIYIAGYTESFGAGAKDAFLLKCNLEGKKTFFNSLLKIIHGKLVFIDREIMPL